MDGEENFLKSNPLALKRPVWLRWLVLITLTGFAVVSLFAAANSLGSQPLMAFFAALIAAGLGFTAWSLGRADGNMVLFDGERLTDDSGAEICRLDEIEAVERGFAFFKPSSGFVLKLKTERGRAWNPGLWWRVGRRVGVGGATRGRAGKAMADEITTVMALAQMPEFQKAKGEAE